MDSSLYWCDWTKFHCLRFGWSKSKPMNFEIFRKISPKSVLVPINVIWRNSKCKKLAAYLWQLKLSKRYICCCMDKQQKKVIHEMRSKTCCDFKSDIGSQIQLVRSWDLWEQRFSQCCLLAEVLCYKYLGRQWSLRDLKPENRGIFNSQATHISRLLKIKTQIVHGWSIWELYFISICTILDILG